MFGRPSKRALEKRIDVLERKLQEIADPEDAWQMCTLRPAMADIVRDFCARNERIDAQPRRWRPYAPK